MFKEDRKPLHVREADDYLQQAMLLEGEMKAAMQAISSNSLQALEESLWRQEVLCVSLKRMLQTVQSAPADTEVMLRMRSASSALHTLNQTYAGLVQQSRLSTDLMLRLSLSYSDPALVESNANLSSRCCVEA